MDAGDYLAKKLDANALGALVLGIIRMNLAECLAQHLGKLRRFAFGLRESHSIEDANAQTGDKDDLAAG